MEVVDNSRKRPPKDLTFKCSHWNSIAPTLSCRIQGAHTKLTRKNHVAKKSEQAKLLTWAGHAPSPGLPIHWDSIRLEQHKPNWLKDGEWDQFITAIPGLDLAALGKSKK